MNPYAPTEDPGLEWLADVPAHWEVSRIKNVAEVLFSNVDKHSKEGERPVRLCNYSDVYYNDSIDADLDFMNATATKEEIDRFRLAPDDVLLTKDSETWDDIGVPSLVREADGNLICGYHLALLRPISSKLLGQCLYWSLSCREVASQLHVRANGVTRFGLSQGVVKSVRIPIPPVAEQAAIARFLDDATRRIDRHIRAKEKLIALLEERKRAIIREAVTGRVDVRTGEPYPDYKPSGLEWFGDVPRHWKVRKIRHCGTISGGMTPSMANRSYWGGDVPWVTPKDMKVDLVDRAAINVSAKAVEETSLKLLPSRVVLLVVRGMILARRVPIAVTGKEVTINQDMKAVYPAAGILPEFLAGQMTSAQDALLAMTDQAGHGTRRLPTERWRDLGVCIPPQTEQQEIIQRLARNQTAAVATIARVAQQLEALREYRTRLIADVVTGKLDVRHLAVELNEVHAGQARDVPP